MSVEEEMHNAAMEFSGKHHRQKLAKAMTILILLQRKQEEEEQQQKTPHYVGVENVY